MSTGTQQENSADSHLLAKSRDTTHGRIREHWPLNPSFQAVKGQAASLGRGLAGEHGEPVRTLDTLCLMHQALDLSLLTVGLSWALGQ
jgi:hypothetical protein